jgi:hypothetical protein
MKLENLPALPKNRIAVTSWQNEDEAFEDIASGIYAKAWQIKQEREQAQYLAKLKIYEQSFSKAVEDTYYLSQEVLSNLKILQNELRLKDDDIVQIEQPIRERAKAKRQQALAAAKKQRQEAEAEKRRQRLAKLKIYEQNFSKAIEDAYPLSQEVLSNLKTLQDKLRLKDDDIVRIEQPILETAEAKHQQGLVAAKQQQEAEAEKRRQRELEQRRRDAAEKQYNEGLHHLDQENYEHAISQFEKAKRNKHPEAHQMLLKAQKKQQ